MASVPNNDAKKNDAPVAINAVATKPVIVQTVKAELFKPVVAAVAKTIVKKIAAPIVAKKPIATKKSVNSVKIAKVTKIAAAKKVATPTKGTNIMTDTVKKIEAAATKFTAEAGDKTQAFFSDFTAKAKTAFEKSGETVKDVVAFNKDNLDAVVEAGKLAAKGAQTSAQTAADFGRKNFEATTTMLKTVAAVKSPTEFFKLQSDFAKSQFEVAVAEMSKSSEFTLKLMGEVFQPISNRYAVAAEKVKARMAA